MRNPIVQRQSWTSSPGAEGAGVGATSPSTLQGWKNVTEAVRNITISGKNYDPFGFPFLRNFAGSIQAKAVPRLFPLSG